MRFFKRAYNYIIYYGFFGSIFYLTRLFFLHCHQMLSISNYAIKRINKKYKMYLNLKDRGISKALYLYGQREKDQVYILQNAISKGMRILDIGANIGYYVLLEADIVGDDGKVYAFEPHEDNFRILKKNIELNNFLKRVELYQMGVSDKEGRMEFFLSPKSNLHTLNPKHFNSKRKEPQYSSSMKIDVADITKFLQEKKKITFIRMDIEGHEVEVLNGLSEGLDKINVFPSILLETHFPKYDDKYHSMRTALVGIFRQGYDIEAVVSIDESKSPLKEMGYKPERIIKTDQMYRGIYYNIDKDRALHCICDRGGIRAIFLKSEKFNNSL